ncbi:LLM class flavin-dependent oxidoreductase [Amycolatopsis roodepoortensis]|uniref:FAD/FMN-containing dehydrogenase/alkanesulfonate monooxygenase SsuD/methylene tetrahydromethanopterin reductase-like flavin-dependent oxidoreductase (Luciferase family) n=1 Tax=Amycolatopsis roodepoortensis TaxID=700274 RepID=A0ABR9L485_9PSEU|nr:LLM class flavin-dependent oxidoreductase [Amycolatopsis roodepoortensis]MBE1575330.1 FAD/FMN-containing dehydrogenase/alkanesulfonate monooxygenase SsuD/methylene tetrahydromethanopterin reductase-like flavin-dependent oxidoreductase (luciferase family) [Amycolatopsis roodepoortensis]
MNYGHRLRFGLRLTTNADRGPGQLAQRAGLAEQWGLDLLVIPAGTEGTDLEPSTVSSWIAGVTGSLGLAVEAQPAYQPAMLARAIASLDQLAEGRVELALRAGPPSAGTDTALGEAIDVVRELWNVLDRGLGRFTGRFHRLAGAQKAAPAHDVPITVDGQGRDVLRLVGRQADGWSTDGDVAALAEGNRVIDETARRAGRDPREIRRLVTIRGGFGERTGRFTGTAADWVSDLLPLVVDHGVGTVVLDTDSEDVAARFANDVAPALRAAVDAALPYGWSSARIRRSAALARRRPGIDYEGTPPGMAEVVEPGDLAYARLRSGYLRGGAPGIILRATTNEQVRQALAFARRHPGVPLSRRSAGHGVSGRSTNDGGIVIDVSLMNTIEVLDEKTRRVRIGPGARWAEVAVALEPYGWALSSGDYGGVGVGGLATAGGVGYLAREHGLTIDHLRAVEMVLADGSIVRAGETENTDLFWAVRGAGANFGIVTAFEFEVDEVGAVAFAQLTQDASDLERYLVEWGRVVEDSPRDLTSFVILPPPRAGRPALALSRTMVDAADRETVLARLEPLAAISPIYAQDVVISSYAAVLDNASDDAPLSRGEPVSRSGLLRHVTPEFAAAAALVIRSGAIGWFQLRSVGGAVADVPADATAYAHRDANFSLVVMGGADEVVDEAWAQLRPFLDGLYLSFESGLRPERLAEAWPPATLSRLRELKSQYDPEGVFDDNFALTPATNDPGGSEK